MILAQELTQDQTPDLSAASLIPVCFSQTKIMNKELDSQLSFMLRAQQNPTLLDKDLAKRIIKMHDRNRGEIKAYNKQIAAWVNSDLSDDQITEISLIEDNIMEITNSNEAIIALAKEFLRDAKE